jgi:hypothetical protein
MDKPDKDLLDMLADDVAAEEKIAEQSVTADLVQKGIELETMKEEIERHEAELKAMKDRYDELRLTEIPELMERVGVASEGRGSFTTATGARISLRNDLHVGYNKEEEQEVFAWLRENGLGDIIKPAVHNATLKAVVRERIEDGKPIPPLITQFYRTSATLTKSRSTTKG